jgi:hypothetical protein
MDYLGSTFYLIQLRSYHVETHSIVCTLSDVYTPEAPPLFALGVFSKSVYNKIVDIGHILETKMSALYEEQLDINHILRKRRKKALRLNFQVKDQMDTMFSKTDDFEGEQCASAGSIILKSMANRHRLLILYTLKSRECSAGELEEIVGLSQSALSQHLARLRKDGLVKTRRAA